MEVDIDRIVSRHGKKDGFRLVGARMVAITVYSLALRVTLVEVQKMPPVDEHLLRMLSCGVASENDVAEILGLDLTLVKNQLDRLYFDEFVELSIKATAEGHRAFELTGKGTDALRDATQKTSKEETVSGVMFHGLLNRPVSFDRESYLRPKDAEGLDKIKSLPLHRCPFGSEVDVRQLQAVAKRFVRNRDVDLLAVTQRVGKVFTFYEPAVLLEFVAVNENEERAAMFCVDGEIREEYGTKFEENNGFKKHRHLLTKNTDDIHVRIRQSAPSFDLDTLGELDCVEATAVERNRLDQAREKISKEIVSLERSDTRELQKKEIDQLKEQIQIQKEKLVEVEDQRNVIAEHEKTQKVKYLWTPEIRDKFWESLDIAEERLLILSGFLSSYVVNADFEQKVRDALKRGVKIWIGYGMDRHTRQGKTQRREQKWVSAVNRLDRIQTAFPDTFIHRDLGRSHEKRIICDDKFTIGGSYNYLSFTGEYYQKRIRHEAGDLVSDPAFCQDVFDRIHGQFFR